YCRYFVSTTVAALFSPRCCSDSAQSLLLRLRLAAAASSLLSRCCSVFAQPLLLSRICHLPRVSGVKPYRKKGLEHYQTLGEIFNTTTVLAIYVFLLTKFHCPRMRIVNCKRIFLVMEFMLILMMTIQWNLFSRLGHKEKGIVGQLQLQLSVNLSKLKAANRILTNGNPVVGHFLDPVAANLHSLPPLIFIQHLSLSLFLPIHSLLLIQLLSLLRLNHCCCSVFAALLLRLRLAAAASTPPSRCCSVSAQPLLLRLRPAAVALPDLSLADMDPHYVDVEDKADWSSRIETVFIRIRVPGVKPYHEDRELEENFLSHGVHVDIDDDDSMEPLFETRTEKRPRRPVATSTERGKKNKTKIAALLSEDAIMR
ncbi:hypothetical protein CUMW_189790, partial [Citrus unshiu]